MSSKGYTLRLWKIDKLAYQMAYLLLLVPLVTQNLLLKPFATNRKFK